MTRFRALIAAAVASAAVSACSDRTRSEPPNRDPTPPRHVIAPNPGAMRALPPHAIRSDGVGPYKLGAQLKSILPQLPSGPRIAQYEIPGVISRSLIRADDDQILIGGEPRGAVGFVAVVGGDVARTESGIHVGSTRAELVRALGPVVEDPDRARDPRLIAVSAIAGLRAVIADDRVVAMVVTGDADAPHHAVDGSSSPPTATATATATATTASCARPETSGSNQLGACLATGELVTVDGDELEIRTADGDRALARAQVAGLVFAAPLREDDRDELIAIARSDDGQQRTWSLIAFRFEGGKLVRAVDQTPLYQLTSANARWIGAELRDVDLYLEATNRPDSIEIGGLLITHVGDRLRDALVISPISVPRRRAHPISAEPDAGVGELPDAQSDKRAHP